MPDSCRLLLRILYTINSSGYILARSTVPVPVTLINNEASGLQSYGSVPFKACLEAICRSSPELMQDLSKDYSVYVLDPLESSTAPAPLDISNLINRSTDSAGNATAEQSRAVAVGMGLMSQALTMGDQDSLTVVGTLGKQGSGQDAIEVIVALREIPFVSQARLPYSSHPFSEGSAQIASNGSLHPSSNMLPRAETLATIASIQNRAKAKNKPKKPPRVSSTPVTESDKLLNENIYIGPARKKGRPKVQTNGESKVKPEGSRVVTSRLPVSSTLASHVGQPATVILPGSELSPAAIQPRPSSNSLDLAALAALLSGSQNEATRNTFLLQALNCIDASKPQEVNGCVNPALVDALHQFLSNVFSQTQVVNTPVPATLSTPPPRTSITRKVLLDKENVHPAALNGRSEGGYQHIKASSSAMSSSDPESVTQICGLGVRSIPNPSPKSAAASTLSGPSTNMRKRTLDDCMEERDNKRNKNRMKAKEKERLDKKDNSRLKQPTYENGFKHYPRLNPVSCSRPEPGTISYYRQPLETWTSPPRKSKENADSHSQMSDSLGGTSLNRPIVIPDSPQASKVVASSPIRPTAVHRKPYVVPSWARTDTALKPRLSEETQKSIEAAAERKKEERQTNRRRTNARAQDRYRQREKLADSEDLGLESEFAGPSQKIMQPLPHPVIPNTDLPPIIASSDADIGLFPLASSRVQSPPLTRAPILLPPVTPKRPSKVATSTPVANDLDQDSLFTPLSIVRRSTGGTGSPLFSPGALGSPLAHKKPKGTSPTSYRVVANQCSSESSTITVKITEDTLHKSKSPAIEIDDVQEDLDCPPSSLPIASSDSEFEDAGIGVTRTTSNQIHNDQTANGEFGGDELPVCKQHWVGLPPSSPPPPTSPCLKPIDNDAEPELGDVGEELPVASETDEPDEETGDEDVLNATESDWSPSPINVNHCITPLPTTAELTPNQDEVLDEMAFLQQFTTLGNSDELVNVQGDFLEGHHFSTDESDSLFASGGDTIDFEKFLDGFKPLMTDGSFPSVSDHTPGFDFSAIEAFSNGEAFQSIDHYTMAAELQAILSGCVV